MLLGFLMTTLLVGCTALRFAPPRVSQPAFTRRAAVLVMDEEAAVSWAASAPFTNVTGAAADIKEVLAMEGLSDALTDEKKDLEAALENGYDPDKVQRLAEVEAMLAEAGIATPVATSLSPEDEAKAAWIAKTYGERPPSIGQNAAAMPAVITTSEPSKEFTALIEEKNDLEAALEYGYDADKVQRLAEVEAMLAEAGIATPAATTLSPEDEAKAAWIAARTRPDWGGKSDAH